jgi:enamine deaminase RidA (YjgF/YER057c/UK114 family)
LVGNAIEEIKIISTPKFERGKYLQFDDSGFLFISGTASIIGEKTVFTDDIAKQTLTTFNNIDHLVSINNLNKNKISVASKPLLLNYRVYLKNESDYATVKALCDTHYGTNKGFIVKADICRSNLLVEIEANYLV